jgi:hypothetical protein
MGAREILAGNAVVEVGTRLAIERGLQIAEARFRAFGNKLRSVGSAFAVGGAAISAGAVAALAPLTAAVAEFAEVGSALDDMAQRTGASVEALSGLSYAAKMSGTDLGAVEGGIRKTQKAITEALDGSASMVEAFDALGLSAAELVQLSPDQQFARVAAAVGAIPDPTRRAAMAMQLFGKSGTELLPLMRSDLAELTTEAKRLGLVLSTEDAQAAATLGDAIDRAGDTIRATWIQIGAAIAPAVTRLVEIGTTLVVQTNDWLKANRDLVPVIAIVSAGVLGAGTAMTGLGVAVIFASGVFTGLAKIAKAASVGYAWLARSTVPATTGIAAATAASATFTPAVMGNASAVVALEAALVTAVPLLTAFATQTSAVALLTGRASAGLITGTVATASYGTASAAAVAPVALLGTTTVATTAATTTLGGTMAAILSPITAVVTAIAGSTAAMVGLVAVVAGGAVFIAAQAGIIGDAYGWLRDRFLELFASVRQTFGGIASALAAGKYVLAARILWAGLKVVFLQGADATLAAMAGLWKNGWSLAQRFFNELLTTTWSVFKSIPRLLVAALKGGQSFAEVLAGVLTGSLDLGDVLDGSVAEAKAELDRLTREAAGKQNAAAAASVGAARAAGGPVAPGGRPAGPMPGGPTMPKNRFEHERTAYKSKAEFDAAEAALQRREAEARRQMAAAAQARARVQQTQQDIDEPKTPEPTGLGDRIAGAGRTLGRVTSAGTFSAAAAGFLGGGRDDRVAGNTAQTNALLRQMLKQRQRGGPTYT